MRERTVVTIDAKISWRGFQDRKSRRWVGVCDALALTVEGKTWAELAETIADALNGLFRDLMDERELSRFLQDRGWKLVGKMPAARRQDVQFDVPFHLARMSLDDQARETRQ